MEGVNKVIARANLDGCQMSMSGKGTEGVDIAFDIQDPKDGEMTGIVWTGWLSEKAAARTLQSLRMCGWKGTDLSDLSGVDANLVTLIIEDETYNGVTRPRIKWINPGPVGVDQKKAMADKFKKLIETMDIEPKEAPSTANDPDLPF